MTPDQVLATVTAAADTCWLWPGAVIKGYGSVRLAGEKRTRLAHRVVYELLAGPIPAGLELDHLCRTTLCCNPAHLEPVTHAENIARGIWQQRKVETRKAKTACRNGHAYTEANTRLGAAGRRRCRTCQREWARAKAVAA